MKLFIYLTCFFPVLLVEALLREELGVSIGVIPTILLEIPPYYLARKWCKHHDRKVFLKNAAQAAMTPFEYAKRTVDPAVINYCESNLNKPTYVVTGYLDKLGDDKKIKRTCADVLIEGYTKIMEDRQRQHSSAAESSSVSSAKNRETEVAIPREPKELPGFVNSLPDIDGDFKKRNAIIITVVIVLVLAIAISAGFAFFDFFSGFPQKLSQVPASETVFSQDDIASGEPLPEPFTPDNGQTIIPPSAHRNSSLSIEALDPGGYYVLLSPIEDAYSKGRMSFFVNYGSPLTITVPSGLYRIYYAAGDNWYGKDHLFGANTEFYVCDSVFYFQSTAYFRVDTLKLERMTADVSTIDKADFPQDFGV